MASSSIYTYEDDNLTSYAEFLRKFGRFLSKDGFIDASSTINRFKLKQIDNDKQKPFSVRAKSFTETTKPQSSVEVIKSIQEKQKVHEKHLKLIEDQMIQSKQEGRGFKRQEGEVKKEQRSIRLAIRELDTVISRKRLDADKNLAKNLEEKSRLEIENAHKREETTKQRTEKNLEILQLSKDKGRKNLLVCNDLARQYKMKMNELDLKHNELNRIQSDFEDKLRAKEEEEASVKREIAEIALALNMETKKVKDELFSFRRSLEKDKESQIKTDFDAQQNLESKISQTSGYIKNYDLNRRRLSHEAVVEKSSWGLKQREATRRIVDTRNNLENIYQRQKKINETFQTAEMDRKQQEIIKNIEDVTNRKKTIQSIVQQEKKEQNEKIETELSIKAQSRFIEQEVRQQEDNLKHIQKIAQKDDEQQHELYRSVKDTEFLRRKQEKDLRKLRDHYKIKQKENSAMIKEILAKVFEEEQEMQQKISREKAKLDKYHSEREESYSRLLSHREKTKEDKFLLENYSKEHSRLTRILNKSLQSNTSA